MRGTRECSPIKHSSRNTRTRFLFKSFPWDPPLGEHGCSLLEGQPVSAANPRVFQALSSGPQRAREASRVGEVERQAVPPAPSPMGRVPADERSRASRSRQPDMHRLPRQTPTDCYTTRKSIPSQKYGRGDSQQYGLLLSAEYMGIVISRRNLPRKEAVRIGCRCGTFGKDFSPRAFFFLRPWTNIDLPPNRQQTAPG